jgi:hypothetical protein
MPTFEISSIIVLGALAWLWYDSLKARDVGIRAARAACASENCQLLDDTVAIASLRLGRNDRGRVLLRRVYDFEFSDNGNNRRRGSVVLLGHSVIVVNIGLRLVSSERTLH